MAKQLSAREAWLAGKANGYCALCAGQPPAVRFKKARFEDAACSGYSGSVSLADARKILAALRAAKKSGKTETLEAGRYAGLKLHIRARPSGSVKIGCTELSAATVRALVKVARL